MTIIDTYIQKNEGYITASKLKVFSRNPEEYFLQYVEKIQLEEKKRHFILGTAFDDLITARVQYGSNASYSYESSIEEGSNPLVELAYEVQVKMRHNEELIEDTKRLTVRLDKYYMDEWLVVEELRRAIISYPDELKYWLNDYAIKSMKLPELRHIYYRDPTKTKVRLTPWESKMILGMYREVLRQPKMDIGGRRGCQVCIETEYKGAKIRWTLDRFVFVDKDKNRYLPSEVDEFIKAYGREKRQELVKDNGIFWVIRDWKTSGNMDNFEYDMEETFDYVISMSFYYVLVLAKYKVSSHVFLDVLSKKEPYWSYIYRLKPERIIDKVKFYIKPLIEDLIRAYEHNIREPIKPLTGEPVTRNEMMSSKYYPYMKWAIQEKIIEPRG